MRNGMTSELIYDDIATLSLPDQKKRKGGRFTLFTEIVITMSGRAGKVRKKRVSRSAKAGVVFPVSR